MISGGKKGENTWNAELASSLKLHGYDSAGFEWLFDTLKGQKKPDVAFQTDKGLYLISAKIGDKEIDAIVSAQEYQSKISQIANLRETYAVVYPLSHKDKFILWVLANKDHKPMSWSFFDFSEMVNKIIEITENDWDAAQFGLESSETSIVRVLRKAVNEFSSILLKIPMDEIEDIFGGDDFFQSAIESSKTEIRPKEYLRSAAAYLFLNQILFYEILASEVKKYPPIEEQDYGKPSIFKPKYFDKVLEDDYDPIFSFDVTGKFKDAKLECASIRIVRAVKALFPGTIEHDMLGKVFHNLIPLDFRKEVAAYYTNSMAGQLLAHLSITDKNDVVIDPAVGSGTLLVAAYNRKKNLYHEQMTEKIHKRFVERELIGIDIMAFSAHLAAVNLALRAPLYQTNKLQIAIYDSTSIKPGIIIPSAKEVLKETFKSRTIFDFDDNKIPKPEKKIRRGAISLGKDTSIQVKVPYVDVVIMNPPFTSRDNLPPEYRKSLDNKFASGKYVDCLTGKLSLQAYFLMLADKIVKENGRIASVLPITTFSGKAFNQLDEFLLKNFSVKYIVVGTGRSAFSENTSLREILFIAEKSKPSENSKFVLIGTKKSPTEWTDEITHSISKSASDCLKSETDMDDALCSIRILPQRELSQSESGIIKLTWLLTPGVKKISHIIEKLMNNSKRILTLHEFEKKGVNVFEFKMRTGSEFGYTALSIVSSKDRTEKNWDRLYQIEVISDSVIIKDRITNKKFKIPKTYTHYSIRRLSGIKTIEFKDRDLVITSEYPKLKEHLGYFYPQNEISSYIEKIHNEWDSLMKTGSSRICFARRIDMTASGTSFLCIWSNKPMFLIANSWGITGLTPEQEKILVLWLNSSINIFSILMERSETRGSFGQIDERQLLYFPIVDVFNMNKDEIDQGVILFDNMANEHFPSIIEQLVVSYHHRRSIDGYFLKILGVTDQEERKEIIKSIHHTLANMMNALKEMMSND